MYNWRIGLGDIERIHPFSCFIMLVGWIRWGLPKFE